MKLLLKSTITHDGIEHHPGIHEIPDALAEQWLKDLPKTVQIAGKQDEISGKKIDLNDAMKAGPITGTEIK